MKLICDFHIHSKFSRATSRDMDLEHLDLFAKIKGIDVMGTGDFTHPGWLSEIKTKLEPQGNGLFKLKKGLNDGLLATSVLPPKTKETHFILTSEISCIYSKGGRVRKIHTVIVAPDIATVEKINVQLSWIGNLKSDGRPILGLDAKELAKIALNSSSNSLVVPAHCLLPETIIHTKNNLLKKIKDIKTGDLVFTHKNRWQKVQKVFKRPYRGKIYHIKPYYFREGLETTPEHPFYVIKTKKNCHWSNGICKPSHQNDQECKEKYYRFYKPAWVSASHLENGDVLIFPRFKNAFNNHSLITISQLLNYFPMKQKNDLIEPIGTRTNLINNAIPITKEFCKLVGYYLAEGYTNDRDAIGFTFHNNEKEYIDEVITLIKRIFAFKGKIKIRQLQSNGTEIIFYSKILQQTFAKLFYINRPFRAENKAMPSWMLGCSLELQVEIFKGWWQGDKGYTSSRMLMNQIKIILLRLGIIPSIYKESKEKHEKRGNHHFAGRVIKANHDCYAIIGLSFFEDKFKLLELPEFKQFKRKSKIKHGWIDDNYVYLPIRNIEIKKFQGEVYNLEVENDNSYTSEFATIHNCWTPWFSIFGSMSGFDTIKECFEEYTPYIYALETGLSCYDKKTEILTENGWKKFPDVKYGDKVCTLNVKTDKVEFQKPNKIHAYYYTGKMYRLKTRRVDLLVTPNHKLLFSHCDFRKPAKFSLKEAKLLFNKSKRLKKDGVWIGKKIDYFVLPAVKIKHGSRFYSGLRNKKEKLLSIKPWLKFFGFWIAEGWATESKNGHYAVCLANQNEKLLLEMKQILKNFGYNAYRGDNIIRVRDYQLFYYLKQFGKSYEKFIPKETKSLSKELLEIFFDYYIKGDGHRYGRTKKGLSATTISTQLRDDLQEIALKIGIAAYYKRGYKKGTPITSLGLEKQKYKQSHDAWIIFFTRRNKHTILPSLTKKFNRIESWVKFKGQVFCVTVPNHVVYIRRNGIPLWCGNSDPEMNWRLSMLDKINLISNSDAHSPAKIGREANIFNCDLSYLDIINTIRKKDSSKFLSTIEFFPEEGKYHFDGHRLCGTRFSPEETIKHKGICPKCKKPVTVGVMNRVNKLADRSAYQKPANSPGSIHLIPLEEIIAASYGTSVGTKVVKNDYGNLIRTLGNEFEVLRNVPTYEIQKTTSKNVADGVARVRTGNVKLLPGFDGEYGKILVFEKAVEEKKQMKLF